MLSPSPSPPGPTVQVQPKLVGAARVGGTLTVDPGTWTGSKPIDFAYQWQRCKPDGSNCLEIYGANKQSYAVQQADLGLRLRSYVWASNKDGRTLAISSMSDIVQAAAAQAPKDTALPGIGGSTTEGGLLMATSGAWQGTPPLGFAYRWQACDPVRRRRRTGSAAATSGTRCAWP